MAANQLIVLVGGSGTGKSTLARALQEQLLPEQWLHFSMDTVLYCLPPSVVDAANSRNDWSCIDVPAVRRTALSCLRALLTAGNRVIFDCVVMTERGARDLVLQVHRDQPLFVAVTCSWQETRRRTLQRGDRTVEEAEHGFNTAGQHLATDCSVDTTQLSPDAAAGLVLTALHQSPRDAWRRNEARLGIAAADT